MGGIVKTPNTEPMEQLSAFISRITSQKEGVNYLSNEVATRYLRLKEGQKPGESLMDGVLF